jgi:hypothetical protein
MAITANEFERMKSAPRSKWSGCIQKLLRAKDGDVVEEPIAAEDDNSYSRQMARKAIYALARHHGIKVSCLRVDKKFLIKRLGKLEVMQ